jgi:hypothetical protein
MGPVELLTNRPKGRLLFEGIGRPLRPVHPVHGREPDGPKFALRRAGSLKGLRSLGRPHNLRLLCEQQAPAVKGATKKDKGPEESFSSRKIRVI